jgi:hypothetical protein
MADSINIFKSSAYLLYKNPILLVLPSIGSIISIVFEAFYLVVLRNNGNNNQNYFPFSDIFILFLFFISFTIAYFQLILISRKIIPKRSPENKNYCYNTIIFEFLVIYSFYAITLADIGGYETEMRGKLASASTTTDHFSMYTSKISIQYDNLFATIVSFGIPLVFLVSIISMFFNTWMVQYILQITADKTKRRSLRSSIFGPYQSLKNIAILTIYGMDKDTKKTITLLFILSTLISITDFVFADIAVIPAADSLSLYIVQFAILNIIEAIYLPFFLVCLFLMFMSRPFNIDDYN